MKKENPAKLFLRRYLGAVARADALNRAINQALERATNTGVTLKEVKVLSSPAEHDPMAADVCTAVDACKLLYEEKAKADSILREILAAINAVQDERQKAVLTMRYVNGDGFAEIAERLHFSEPAIFVSHGRALANVNRWLEVRKHDGNERGSNMEGHGKPSEAWEI